MKPINREIIALALPSIVSNITTPLLGLVDTAVTGHMGSAAYIGAIAVGAGMFSLVYWPMAFLRMGTSGITSQAYGSGAETLTTLCRAAIAAIAVSLALILLSPILCTGLLAFMDADDTTTQLARTYFLIVVLGSPAVLCTYALTGWFLGMQDSRAPMWMSLVTNVSNIAISLTLVYYFGMKIEGVAIGTLSAQWLGIIAGIVFLFAKIKGIGISTALKISEILDRRQLRRFFTVNGDIFLRTLCLAAVTLWFTHAGATNGPSTLAANALLMQLFILFSYFMDGFAFAGEAMAGKYFGAGNLDGLKSTIKGVFRWGVGVVMVFTLIYGLCGREILELLSDNVSIVATAMHYLPWAIAIPAAGVSAFVWDGIFIGTTLTRQMLQSMVAAMVVYFALFFTLQPLLGNHGLWLAFIAYLCVRGGVQTWLWIKYRPKS